MATLAASLLCTVAIAAQAPPSIADETVALAYPPMPDSGKEMTTVIKLVAGMNAVSFNAADSSFTMRGPANVLGLAEWLLHAMDKPPGWQASAQDNQSLTLRQYLLPGGGYPFDDTIPVTRVYYLLHADQRGMYEILASMRSAGEMTRTFPVQALRMVIFRGNASTVDLGEWMIRELDIPADGTAFSNQKKNPGAGVFRLPNKPDGSEDIVQVFYLDPSTNSKALNDLVVKIRGQLNIGTRIFQKVSPPTITARGTSALLAQVQEMVNSQ